MNLRFIPSVSPKERKAKEERSDSEQVQKSINLNVLIFQSIIPSHHRGERLKCVPHLSACNMYKKTIRRKRFPTDTNDSLLFFCVCSFRVSESAKNTFYIKQDGKAFRNVLWSKEQEPLTHWTEYLEPPQNDFDMKGFQIILESTDKSCCFRSNRTNRQKTENSSFYSIEKGCLEMPNKSSSEKAS